MWVDHSCLSPAPRPSLQLWPTTPTCATTWDADGHRYLVSVLGSLTPEEAYCRHLQAAGGFCCTQAEFEALN